MADVKPFLVLSMGDAKRLGLLVCVHCWYPENNHFDFAPRKCAHDSTCPGYQETSKVGTIWKPVSKKKPGKGTKHGD